MTEAGRQLSMIHEYLLYLIGEEIDELKKESAKYTPEVEAEIREQIQRLKKEITEVTIHCYELRESLDRRKR